MAVKMITSVKRFSLATIIFSLLLLITVTSSANIPPTDVSDSQAIKYIRSQTFSRIIIDVDAGVDDAFALLLALAKPRPKFPKVIAITCTHGNTNVSNVAINVLKTLRVMNLTIPVYVGATASLILTPDSDDFYGKDGLGDIPDPNPPSLNQTQKEHAAVALVRLARQYAGDLGVVALGPLTNIALALRLDPKFKKNVNRIYWMGGSIQGIGNIQPGIEFNAFMDPEANFIVFNSSGAPIITYPWETCIYHSEVSKEWRIHVLGNVNSSSVKFLNSIEAKSLRSNVWSSCDAKAIAVVLDPTIANKAIIHNVEPIYEGDGKGILVVDYKDMTNKPKNSVLVTEINTQMFKSMCLEILS